MGIRPHFASVHQIDTEYQHLVNLQNPDQCMDETESDTLNRLLRYGPAMAEVEHAGQSIFVIPRFGTISPWSTKAIDIAHHCGLTKIARIERGIAFYITAEQTLSTAELLHLADFLHDPMTESVVFELADAQQLFAQEEPRVLFEVPLLSSGKRALVSANQELGLALSDDEIDYLAEQYKKLKKTPLM